MKCPKCEAEVQDPRKPHHKPSILDTEHVWNPTFRPLSIPAALLLEICHGTG